MVGTSPMTVPPYPSKCSRCASNLSERAASTLGSVSGRSKVSTTPSCIAIAVIASAELEEFDRNEPPAAARRDRSASHQPRIASVVHVFHQLRIRAHADQRLLAIARLAARLLRCTARF